MNEIERNEYKNVKTEFWLCCLLGWTGAHRFYRKDYKMGVLWLLTCGCFGIGWIIDLIQVGVKFYESTKAEGNGKTLDKRTLLIIAAVFVVMGLIGAFIQDEESVNSPGPTVPSTTIEDTQPTIPDETIQPTKVEPDIKITELKEEIILIDNNNIFLKVKNIEYDKSWSDYILKAVISNKTNRDIVISLNNFKVNDIGIEDVYVNAITQGTTEDISIRISEYALNNANINEIKDVVFTFNAAHINIDTFAEENVHTETCKVVFN